MERKHNLLIVSFLILFFIGLEASAKHQGVLINHNNNSFQEAPDGLIGKWIMDGDPDTYIELSADGSALEKSIGDPLKRYWSVEENALCLKATPDEGGTKICLDYKLSENNLVLTMNGMKLYYVRYTIN